MRYIEWIYVCAIYIASFKIANMPFVFIFLIIFATITFIMFCNTSILSYIKTI